MNVYVIRKKAFYNAGDFWERKMWISQNFLRENLRENFKRKLVLENMSKKKMRNFHKFVILSFYQPSLSF